MDCETWKRDFRELVAPFSLVRIECQVEHHLCIVILRSIVRVASWVVGEMRKEGLISVTVIILRRKLDWGILHAVELRFVDRLFTISGAW